MPVSLLVGFMSHWRSPRIDRLEHANVSIQRQQYGEHDGIPVERFVLSNDAGMQIAVLSYGAAIQEIWVPDREGTLGNVTLGFSTLDGYLGRHPHFGTVLGRVANRLRNASFVLDGVTYRITTNRPPHSAHGGAVPFDKFVWEPSLVDVDGIPGVQLSLTSPDGDQGYPGTLKASVTYSLTGANELVLAYRASTDKPTVLNLTNHAYFNLGGEGSGTVEDHLLQLFAGSYTPTDDAQLPTGEITPVEGTGLDFREARPLRDALRDAADPQIRIARGVDHNFVIDRPDADDRELRRAARLTEPVSGRVMETWTTLPGVQVYTSNSLDGSVAGFSGRLYRQTDAICFETQHFPDSPNQPGFPSVVLRPGEVFTSKTVYAFSIA
jgi:aldose 1-epimerase